MMTDLPRHQKVAILLPVHNALPYTKKTLENLHQLLSSDSLTSSGFDFKIVVVDDGSTDGTFDWIQSNFPFVYVLSGDGTLWWSGGINRAAVFALSELNASYLLLWNNDIVAEEDYFPALCRILAENKPEIIVGSKVFFAGANNILWSMGGYFNRVTGIKYPIGFGEYDGETYRKQLDVDWLPGMGTCLHRSIIEKIGYWDEVNFPQYHGDSDFTCRARENGFILRVYPELRLWNHTDHTGALHQGRWKDLFRSFSSIRSNYHIGKDIMFYHRHGKGIFCYYGLFIKYLRYVGGFLKKKLLDTLGIGRKNSAIQS